MMSSQFVFCPANSPKPKEIQFTANVVLWGSWIFKFTAACMSSGKSILPGLKCCTEAPSSAWFTSGGHCYLGYCHESCTASNSQFFFTKIARSVYWRVNGDTGCLHALLFPLQRSHNIVFRWFDLPFNGCDLSNVLPVNFPGVLSKSSSAVPNSDRISCVGSTAN